MILFAILYNAANLASLYLSAIAVAIFQLFNR